MRTFAKSVGVSLTFSPGSTIFVKGDPGDCLYIIQSGMVEILVDDNVVELCGPNEALGFMSMIDDAPRASTARVKDAAEVSVLDKRKFRFMIDEIPNFSFYIMGAMARRIRGLGKTISDT